MILKIEKLNIKSGFSLMEMLVVMLIAAVIAAATAPMINKKVITNTTSDSPWMWTGLKQSIIFNMDGQEKTVNIAGIHPADISDPNIANTDKNPRVYVETIAEQDTRDDCPQAELVYNNSTGAKLVYLITKDTGIALGNIVKSIGKSLYQDRSVAIGLDIQSISDCSVAIGYGTRSGTNNTGSNGLGTAIGYKASAIGENSVAIGNSSEATANNSIAIGSQVTVSYDGAIILGSPSEVGSKSVTIGNNTKATGEGSAAAGYSAQASGGNSTAVGNMATSGTASIALGKGARAVGTYSAAIGLNANAQNNNHATIYGYNAYSTGADSTSLGSGANAAGNSTAIGFSSTTGSATETVAIGTEVNAYNGKKFVKIGDTSAVASADVFDEAVIVGTTADPGVTRSASGAVLIGKDSLTAYAGNIVIGANAGAGLSTNSTNSVAIGGNANHVTQKNTVGIGSLASSGNLSSNDIIAFLNSSTHIPGSIYYGSVVSDIRLKNVGKPFTGGLAEIRKLVPYNFTFKKDKNNTPHVGVIAQDLQKVFPNAVMRGDDGFLYIRLEDMFYTVINSIKELSNKIDVLDNMIAKKQNKIDELEKRKNDLEQRIAKLEGNIQ